MSQKYLIINIDDYGMCHSANVAAVEIFKKGLAGSCTLMVPCPWAEHGIKLLKENPDIQFGVHLTIISEHQYYRWGPVCPTDKVPSLVPDGRFFHTETEMDKVVQNAKLSEVETEFRTQIEYVLDKGLKPTHLDSHCNGHELRDDIFDMTAKLAEEYNLHLRTASEKYIGRMKQCGGICVDHPVVDSFRIETNKKFETFDALIRDMKPGLNEFAIHPALETGECKAISPEWHVRVEDYRYFNSTRFVELLNENNIKMTTYGNLPTA